MIRQPRVSHDGRGGWTNRLALAGLLVLQLCGGLIMTEKAIGVELRLELLDKQADEISLRYELLNSTDGRIFVFDQMLYFDTKGATRLNDTGAHVFDEGGGTVRIVRGFVAPPMFMSVARRPPIVASSLQPGWESAGVIKLPLPLGEGNPYFPPQACDPKWAHPVTRLRVQVGWVEERDGMKISTVKIDDKALTRLSGGWGSPLQRVAEGEIAVRGVALCPYSGRFDRPQLQQ